MNKLDSLLTPKSIAIIGASPDPNNLARGRLIPALVQGGFTGKIYPVNPNHEEIYGYKTYKKLIDIPEPFDLALIVISAKFVPDTFSDLAKCGCKFAVIYSSGFSEVGGEFSNFEEQLKSESIKHNIKILGPNGVGFLNVTGKVSATFSPGASLGEIPRNLDGVGKRLVIVSQSGGLGFALYQRAVTRGLAVSHVVSTGNEAGITTLDIVENALEDEMVGCIALYIEQLRDTQKLRPIAEKALAQRVPIIIMKAGRSSASQRAALSHTASIVGSDTAYEAMFSSLGIIRAFDQQEIIDLAAIFTTNKNPLGKKIGVISISGGGAIWLTDSCSDLGLEIPEFSSKLQNQLRNFLPEYAGVRNPIDITAQSLNSDINVRTLELLASSNEIDILAVVATLSEPKLLTKDKSRILEIMNRTLKPVVFCSYTIPKLSNISDLHDCGIPNYTSFTGCAKALHALWKYEEFINQRTEWKIPSIKTPKIKSSLNRNWTESDLKEIYHELTIRTPISIIAKNVDAALTAATSIGYPVVLKLQDPEIVHKSKVGALALGLETKAELIEAFNKVRCASKVKSDSPILIQEMISAGLDVIIGTVRDKDFGTMIMVGKGGTKVEEINDTRLYPAPISKEEAKILIQKVRLFDTLLSDGSSRSFDLDALTDVIVKVSAFAVNNEHIIDEFEINPLRVFSPGHGVIALDGYMKTLAYEELHKNV
tara:strand:- start:38819 stop:40945 length:2127 start_codon:yes stop_codon:yes gene_type:complete